MDIKTGNKPNQKSKKSFRDFLHYYRTIISKIRTFTQVFIAIIFILVVISAASFGWLSIIAAFQGYDQKYQF